MTAPATHIIHYLTGISIWGSLFIFFGAISVLPIRAVSSCNLNIDHVGPQYPYPVDNAAASCINYDNDSKNFTDFISHATVSCVDKVEMLAEYVGSSEFKDLINQQTNARTGEVQALLGIDKNLNFSLDNDTLDKKAASGRTINDEYQANLFNVSMKNYYLPSSFASDYAFKGISNLDAAEQTYPNAGNLNSSNPYQRLTSVYDQLLDACENADAASACDTDGAANNYLCANWYGVNANKARSVDVAKEMLRVICNLKHDVQKMLDAYYAIPKGKQLSYISLEPVKAAQKFFIVIKPYCAPDVSQIECGIYRYLWDVPDPYIIQGFLPEAPAIAKGAETDYRRWASKEEGEAAIGEANAYTGMPDGKTWQEKIAKKVEMLDPGCNLVFTKNQFMGSHAESKAGSPLNLNISFDFIKHKVEDALNPANKLLVYKAWIVSPKETNVLEYLASEHARHTYGSEYTTAIDSLPKIAIPQPILEKKSGGSTNPAVTPVPVPCPSPGTTVCYDTQPVAHLEYSAGNPNAGHPGGKDTYLTRLNAGNKNLWSLYDANNWLDETCYYRGLGSRNPQLVADIGADAFASNSSADMCTLDFGPLSSKDNKPGSNSDVCSVADEYGVDCCLLEGIMENETGAISGIKNYGSGSCSAGGKTFNCCHGSVCGPAQIMCNQYADFAGGEDLDLCDVHDSAILLARALYLKNCQAKSNKEGANYCQSYDWTQWGNYAMQNAPITNLDPAAYFYGLENGCTVSACSQYRWGAGKGYCDSVQNYCDSGQSLNGNTDSSFCDECNQEITRAGQHPINCGGNSNQGNM